MYTTSGDTIGLDWWTNVLVTGEDTPAGVEQGMALSDEASAYTIHLRLTVDDIARTELGHAPDPSTVDSQVLQLRNGMSVAALRQQAHQSAEASTYRANSEAADNAARMIMLQKIYNLYLHRAPDAEGQNYYMANMQNGMQYYELENSVANSQEHANLVATFKNGMDAYQRQQWNNLASEVTEIFNRFLQRNPSPKEADRYTWLILHNPGRESYVEVSLEIASSVEARQLEAAKPFDVLVNDYTSFLHDMFTANYGRNPSAVEIADYVAEMIQGKTKPLVAEEIGSSPEAQAYSIETHPQPEWSDYSIPSSYVNDIQPLQLNLFSSSQNYNTNAGDAFSTVANTVKDAAPPVQNLYVAMDDSEFTGTNLTTLSDIVSQKMDRVGNTSTAVVEVRAARPGVPISLANPRWEELPIPNTAGTPLANSTGPATLYRLTFDPDSNAVRYTKTFSIIAHGQVHERLLTF